MNNSESFNYSFYHVKKKKKDIVSSIIEIQKRVMFISPFSCILPPENIIPYILFSFILTFTIMLFFPLFAFIYIFNSFSLFSFQMCIFDSEGLLFSCQRSQQNKKLKDFHLNFWHCSQIDIVWKKILLWICCVYVCTCLYLWKKIRIERVLIYI